MTKKTRLNAFWIYFLNILLMLIIFLPLMFSLTTSFRPQSEMFKYLTPITWKTFIPVHFTAQAYIDLFKKEDFGRVFFNTFFVAGVTVLFGIIVNSMAAFAFSTFEFKGKKVLFLMVLITFMIPFEIIAVPLYKIVTDMGLIDSYYALIVPVIANGLVIFLFKQFFDDLPKSLYESARIDGCSWWRIYMQIVLPLSKPVIVSAALLIFVGQWESFLWPLLSTHSPEYRVIQIAMSNFTTEHATSWNQLFAASNLAIIVPVVLLLFLQQYFVKGLANTGSKE